MTCRVVMADDDEALCITVSEFCLSEPSIDIVATVHDGVSAIAAVQEYSPDLLLLDMSMPRLDGLGVLQAIRQLSKRPKVMVFTAFANEGLISEAVAAGANYYVVKPFDLPTLVSHMQSLVQPHLTYQQLRVEKRRQQLETEVVGLLAQIGVPSHYSGYNYLRDAIMFVLEDNTYTSRITRGLYPDIAERHCTTAHIVERAIRHAIEVTWVRGKLDTIHRLFPYSIDANKGKPTNSSFIARIADEVRMYVRAG